jgi:phosphopantothenoylcysteine decarboxylase/phosphopantothenate--cysteine ligase
MGIRIAEEAVKRGAEVWLILGPSEEPVTSSTNLHIHRIISADHMMLEVEKLYKSMDYFILAAAVADFKPEFIADEKIKKSNFNNQLKLVPTPDIASFLGTHKKSDQKLIGFALETTNIIENAQIKLDKKNMDMIVINSPKDPGAAFGHNTNKISILKKAGELISFELKSKGDAAKDILNEMLKLKH